MRRWLSGVDFQGVEVNGPCKLEASLSSSISPRLSHPLMALRRHIDPDALPRFFTKTNPSLPASLSHSRNSCTIVLKPRSRGHLPSHQRTDWWKRCTCHFSNLYNTFTKANNVIEFIIPFLTLFTLSRQCWLRGALLVGNTLATINFWLAPTSREI